MADQTPGETIRQMLAGFNTMQANLGLLPVNSGQQLMGPSLTPAPPPPSVMHPAEAAVAAMSRHQDMIAQTMQAAQMTRYQPPPSAPAGGGFGWGASMGQMASQQVNPFVAGALGGGGMGMPNPMSMTAPQYGMFRGGGGFGGGGGGPFRMPSIFNPFTAHLPAPQFMSPTMYGMQTMMHGQSQMVGALAGATEMGLGMGGSYLGGAIGTAVGGPIGTAIGSVAGNMVGGFLGKTVAAPAVADMARGRMLQQMTSPYLMSGASLDPFSGQGLSREAGVQMARGVRHLGRDYDYGRTGFNTQDTMRITQLSAEQGLMQGLQNPDEMLRKVKDISKTVKVLMRITGDPDVRDAIASLGQMHALGFEGLARQAGAVANRSMFARMAGVSQSAMGDMYGTPGAMMAQQVGLSGATGYSAGMAGGAIGNLAASSGALSDLQLARAGGRQGVGQMNTMAQIAAMQQDVYLAAALKKGKGGLEVDIDAYRKAQTMTVAEVSREASQRLNQMGAEGIFEWRTRRQEFKDKIAQQLSPLEMSMNVVRQAQGLQKQVPGMDLGAAMFSTVRSNAVGSGMDDAQAETMARTLSSQYTNRGFYDAQIQQLRAQRRVVSDQERARREQYRTPGITTRASRGIRNALGDVGDAISSPFAGAADYLARVHEDEEAAGRGERVGRYDDLDIAHNAGERAMMRGALRGQDFRGASRMSGGPFDRDKDIMGGAADRGLNFIGSSLGLASESDANRIVSIASRSYGSAFGWHPLGAFGSTESAIRRVRSVTEAARAMDDATSFNGDRGVALSRKLQTSGDAAHVQNFNAGAALNAMTQSLYSSLREGKAGLINSADAASGDMLGAAAVQGLMRSGMKMPEAIRTYQQNKVAIHAAMARDVQASGDQSFMEQFAIAQNTATDAQAVGGLRSRKGLDSQIDRMMSESGLSHGLALNDSGSPFDQKYGAYEASGSTLREMKGVFSQYADAKTGDITGEGKQVLSLAAALSAASSGNENNRKNAAAYMDTLARKVGHEKFSSLKAAANARLSGMSDDARQGMRAMLEVGDPGKLEDRVGRAGQMFGLREAAAAQTGFLQQLRDSGASPDVVDADSMEGAIRNLTGDDLDRLGKRNPKLAKLVEKVKAGKMSAADAAAEVAPGSAKEIYGGGAGGDMDKIDEQIASIEKMRDELSPDDKQGQIQAASSELLAGAAKDLKEAAASFKNAADNGTIAGAHPVLQAILGSMGVGG